MLRASVFDFAAEVDRQIAQLTREEIYRRGGRAKRLIEELYPLSRFALHCKHPGTELEVKAFEDDGPLDGVFCFSGNRQSEFHVEVTYVHSYEEALRRELLWTTGSTPAVGRIFRDKVTRKIFATQTLETAEQESNRLATAIIELFKKKCAKKYERGTILLIAIDDPTFFGSRCWGPLITAIGIQSGVFEPFGEVNLFNCATNELQIDI
ncbi:MAG TPA: hypothetical protein VM689_07385 [Aliidongia sp.]|nr:hypothetical protein [Aliidongia sp.]